MGKLYEHKFWTSPDGLKLHYRDYAGPKGGAKLPVMCLHGLTRNARDFALLADEIAQTRRVIVPEMRGRGRSEYAKDTATYNPLTYIADVQALLAEQSIERLVSIGTSMGGLMTMLMGAQNASLFEAVVLNDIGPEIDPEGLSRIAGYVGQGGSFPTWMHAARALQSVHSAAFPDYTIDQWLEMAKRTLIVTQNGRLSYDYDMGIADPFKEADGAAPPDLWPAFDALKDVPMVLIRGELSDLLTADTAAQMASRNADCSIATVPRVGHAPMLDEADSLSAIMDLLERVA